MKIIVGLGNPGMKYERTRHNAGFEAIDALAKNHGIKVKERKHKALIGQGLIGGEKVILVKPQTFMNNSGEAVIDILNFYKLDANKDLIIISDDVYLDVGVLRIRTKGSAGGHNGLKSIIAHTHTEGFARIRVGVGKVEEDDALVTHVLERFSRAELAELREGCQRAAEAVELMVSGNVERAMNLYNGKK